jgi:hypothetical protein
MLARDHIAPPKQGMQAKQPRGLKVTLAHIINCKNNDFSLRVVDYPMSINPVCNSLVNCPVEEERAAKQGK